MNAPPYQKLFWGSYHKHTAHLRHAREHGAYLLLIGALWNNDGRLPADDDTLAAYAMLTTKEWLTIKPKLMPLFRVVRGKLTQPRVTEDLAKYRDTSGKRKEAGKAGGRASAGKIRGNQQANAADLPTKPEPESEPKKETPIPPDGGAEQLDLEPDAAEPVDEVKQAFDHWNELATEFSLPIAKDLTEARRRAIRKRLETAGPAGWTEALAAVKASAFCLGQTKPKPDQKPFKADLDFVCQPKSFQRLREGYYGADAKPSKATGTVAPDPDGLWRRRMLDWTKNRYWNSLDWGPKPGSPGCQVPARLLPVDISRRPASEPAADLLAFPERVRA